MKLVVRVVEAPKEDKVYVALQDGPALPLDAGNMEPLDCVGHKLVDSLQDDEPGEPVKAVGKELFTSLRTAHSAIDSNLRTVLAQSERCPIYLLMSSPTSAQYPWETLFDPDAGRFLALEERWPIARIAEFNPGEKEVQYFAPPLRVLAVLSAVGIDAAGEWRDLWGELERCSVPFEVHAVVGQHSLKEEIDGLADPRINCELLSSQLELKHQIKQANPHLLHFFCHGKGDSPLIMFGTASDHVSGVSSVLCESDYLRGLAPNAWLVTLNCCAGASDTKGVRSLAHLLIAAGYPAVVGMREPITASDANLFTQAFYRALVEKLSTELGQGDEVEIEITTMLCEPRQALRNKFVPDLEPGEAAAARREWSVPVLYVRPAPLKIQPVPTRKADEYRTAQLSVLHRARLGLHADTPAGKLEAIDAKIEQLLQELRPA